MEIHTERRTGKDRGGMERVRETEREGEKTILRVVDRVYIYPCMARHQIEGTKGA